MGAEQGVKKRLVSDATLRILLGLLCVACLAAGGFLLWESWGAEHWYYWKVHKQARSQAPSITCDDMEELSPQHQREIVALLVRRLAAERTKDLAHVLLSLRVEMKRGLSLFTAEDVPHIIAAVRGDPQLTMSCAWLLAVIATPEAEQCLLEAAPGLRVDWEDTLYDFLDKFRPAKVPDVLLKRATQEGEDRTDVLTWLGSFDDPRVLPILLEAAHDEERDVRWRAVEALGHYPGEATERALLEALQDEDVWVRDGACSALLGVGTADSIPLLIDVLAGSREESVSQGPTHSPDEVGAARALQWITGEDFGYDAAKWRIWWKEVEADFNLEEEFIERLFAPLPPPPERPAETNEERMEQLSHPYAQASFRQVRALLGVESRNLRSLAPHLARYLETPSSEAHWHTHAAQALTKWGYREGIEWMMEWVDDFEPHEFPLLAIQNLGRACGVNFFSDKQRWQEWWKQNRDRFPSAAEE